MSAGYYPDSKVEISGFMARHYDALLDLVTFGGYSKLISRAIGLIGITPDDRILDLGAGTGRNACLMMKHLSSDGEIVGLDISEEMISQFEKRCSSYPNARIIHQRIDVPFKLDHSFTKVFISFVLHGFPQEARLQIIRNAFASLEPRGEFVILDYNEFSLNEMPLRYRIPFKIVECRYAFDFIKRDWKAILKEEGFGEFTEHLFFKGFIRLLKAVKLS